MVALQSAILRKAILQLVSRVGIWCTNAGGIDTLWVCVARMYSDP